MRVCPKCETEHNNKGLYCSRSCANSRTFTKESKEKKSLANKKFYESLDDSNKESIKEKLLQHSLANQGKLFSNLLEADFEKLTYQSKRKRVIVEQEFKCKCCSLDKWLDQPIVLELEHIDGNHQNNERHNLVALCPNCHSMSWSWRGRKNNSLKELRLQRQKEYLEKLKPPLAHGEQVGL